MQILATPFAYVMRFLYDMLQNYGWTLVVFTLLLRLVQIPVSIMQQKKTARTQAYMPFEQEIRKQWAKDPRRRDAELQKFYEENDVKPAAGCLPSVISLVIMFGMIGVIQAPLRHIVGVSETNLNNGISIVQATLADGAKKPTTFTQESVLIGEIKNDPDKFIEGVDITTTGTDADGNETTTVTHIAMEEDAVNEVLEFNFTFMGFDLSRVPRGFNKYIILPILSVLTMLASQFVTFKMSPTQQNGMKGMMAMMLVMSVWIGWFTFTIPVAFALYYTISNIIALVQAPIMRKLYNPDEMRAQIVAEMEERKKAKKAKKKVQVKDESGKVVDREVSDAELARIRLERARKLDEEKYAQTQDEKKKEEEAVKAAEEALAKKEAEAEAEKAAESAGKIEEAGELAAETTETGDVENAPEEDAESEVSTNE